MVVLFAQVLSFLLIFTMVGIITFVLFTVVSLLFDKLTGGWESPGPPKLSQEDRYIQQYENDYVTGKLTLSELEEKVQELLEYGLPRSKKIVEVPDSYECNILPGYRYSKSSGHLYWPSS